MVCDVTHQTAIGIVTGRELDPAELPALLDLIVTALSAERSEHARRHPPEPRRGRQAIGKRRQPPLSQPGAWTRSTTWNGRSQAMNRFKVRVGRARCAVVLAAMAALTLAGPALAARPTREIIDIGTPEIEALISADLSAWCGFEIAVDADQTVTVMVFSRNDGTFHREIDHWQTKWTITNVGTGASITVHNVGPDIYWVNREGVKMLASTGRSYIGQPPVGAYFVGRVLIDYDTGEILRTSGHFVGDIQQVICDPLAP
jgi:hypothetical protein